ncbi:hypothetical protein M885DRAFT_521027 [Pelagophyceae sp. CCMP2097]|nr:hypothetical protein M885DRAFT_521027 [Pelagophyceae sp. CCMP2097]
MRQTCAVCWEPFLRPLHLRQCCRAHVCWSCAHAHVRGVLTDDSRFEIKCPACASCTLTDLEVRKALWVYNAFGLFRDAHRRDVRAWERWSVATGLRGCGDDIVRCPGIDCDNLWVVKRDRRAAKVVNEPTKTYNIRLWGFYAPPRNDDGGDDRRIFCESCNKAFCSVCRRNWQQAKRGHRPPMEHLRDGRPALAAPMQSHDLKACVAFARKSISMDDDFSVIADALNCSSCPSCSLRVERTVGCNHITCPQCAQHFCFICEQAWDNRHYRCRDEEGNAYKLPERQCPLS